MVGMFTLKKLNLNSIFLYVIMYRKVINKKNINCIVFLANTILYVFFLHFSNNEVFFFNQNFRSSVAKTEDFIRSHRLFAVLSWKTPSLGLKYNVRAP
jgi:hypothetical protein